MKKYQVDDYIGRYRIKKIIGSGSFGTVYEVERKEGKRVYNAAIKVIHISKEDDYGDSYLDDMSEQDLSDYYSGLVDELIEECALMEDMKGDSHIVSYEDHFVELDSLHASWTIGIRMELLASFSKAYKMPNSPMAEKDVVKLGIDICKALETCEKKNKVIHRDIKPENIFVSKTGNYKLGDFGIAKVLGQRENTSSKKGTEVYMAPEVYKGLPYDITVDIYSLGLMLYRLMNRNRAPFLPLAPTKITYNDTKMASYKRLNSDIAFNLPQDASEVFSKVILKACSYNPKNRYQRAIEMRNDLEKIVNGNIETDYPAKLWNVLFDESLHTENNESKTDINSMDNGWKTDEMEGGKTFSFADITGGKSKKDINSNIPEQELSENEMAYHEDEIILEEKPQENYIASSSDIRELTEDKDINNYFNDEKELDGSNVNLSDHKIKKCNACYGKGEVEIKYNTSFGVVC